MFWFKQENPSYYFNYGRWSKIGMLKNKCRL